MTNEKAFQLYLATKLHFTTSYDVFESKGRFNGMHTCHLRKDFNLIIPLVKKTQTARNLIEFCVSNFLYGNDKFLYSSGYPDENYNHWVKVKESITQCLYNDLTYIELQLLKKGYTLDDYLRLQVVDDLLSHKVEYESIILMDRYQPLIDKIQGFDGGKYKVRMHKASMFVNKGILAEKHVSHLDNFFNALN